MSRNPEATHAPTPQRFQRARSEGKFAKSRDLVWAGIWISCVSSIAWFGPVLIERWKYWVRQSWTVEWNDHQQVEPWQPVTSLMLSMLPILVMILAGTIAFNLVQGGWGIFPDRIRPQLSRLSREHRGFSIESILSSAATLLKIISLLVVSGLFLYWRRTDWMMLGAQGLEPTFEASGGIFLAFAFQVAIVLGCFGLIDYGMAKFEYSRGLRMTDQDLRDEQRQLDGNPVVHSARSVIYRERTVQQPPTSLSEVDLLVVDGRASAFAISWNDSSQEQGTMLRRETGSQAILLISGAGSRGVEVRRDIEMARKLSRLNVGDEFDWPVALRQD